MELLILILSLYIILFLLSIKLKDNSIVDIFWGIGFIIISIYLFLNNSNIEIEKIIILILISIWGLRLSYYIFRRKLKEKKEDPRYELWRKSWKYFYLRSFFQVFILQMLLMFVISLPIFYIFSGDKLDLNLTILGIFISTIGLILEIVSDFQVKQFINKYGKINKVFTGGLYKYSRNPNYFGESTFWLGLSIIGASINLLSFIGFLVITFLLLFVSGVPLKEKRQEKKENWLDYKSKTNKFIPWFPKN
ncbi:MAG: DUF1295 domain-containing protein [Candidatus Gracilibacteria bacterium]|nr:DUF1295 domain-containing protein [Candidatus Gracilibacteria bacterium]